MKFKTIIWLGCIIFALGLGLLMMSNVVDWFVIIADIFLPLGGSLVYVP